MNMVKLADTVYFRFCTVNETGQAVNADSTPTVDVEEDGVSMASNGGATVTNVSTGIYRLDIPVTTGNSYEVGKRYNAMITAVVDGVTSHQMIAEFLCTARYPDDLLHIAEVYEGTKTVQHFLRLAAARLFNKATVPSGSGSYAYRDDADSKDRIVGTVVGSARTVTTRDGT